MYFYQASRHDFCLLLFSYSLGIIQPRYKGHSIRQSHKNIVASAFCGERLQHGLPGGVTRYKRCHMSTLDPRFPVPRLPGYRISWPRSVLIIYSGFADNGNCNDSGPGNRHPATQTKTFFTRRYKAIILI